MPERSAAGVTTVGLTGGIGSGKSTVARMLAERGAYVVAADDVAREVVARGSVGLERLVAEFGRCILAEDGNLDRKRLARIAFTDGEARVRLESITHPLIGERTAELFALAPSGVVRVHDVPLLVELGLGPLYGTVVVVDCPAELRVERLVARGMSEDDARARMAAQASHAQTLAMADVVIDNSGSLADLEGQVDRLWGRLGGH